MSVYERRYEPYTGPRSRPPARLGVIARYAWSGFSQSRLFLASLVGAAFVPCLGLLLVYLHHNAQALQVLSLSLADLVPIDGSFFYLLLWPQHWVALWFALLAGPGLLTRDLSGAALPLYFSRAIGRGSYLAGKAGALMALLLLVTALPIGLVWLLQASLAGAAWAGNHLGTLTSILLSSVAWALLLCLLSMAIGAWVRWTPVARLLLLGLLSVPSAFAMAIFELTKQPWGMALAPMLLVRNLRVVLMGNELTGVGQAMQGGLPSLGLGATVAALGLWIGLGLLALRVRVRPMEVQR